MFRHSVLLLLACVPVAALAAPVPPDDDAAKLQRAYGTWTDPGEDIKYALKGGELRISLPVAGRHLLGGEREGATNNAPRILRDVEGDFSATVRITFPVPEKVAKRGWVYWSGGLLAWESEKESIVVRRAAGTVNGNPEAIWTQLNTATVCTLMVTGFAKPAEFAFVRLQRTGRTLTTGWSHDGTVWKSGEPLEVAWGKKLKVGVVAENCLGVPVEITFDQYSLTQPKQ